MNAARKQFEASVAKAALDPRSVAIIGASDNPDKIGGRPIAYLKRFGFKGAVYPVNPNRPEVQGHRAYRDLSQLPEVPELAIVAVPGADAVEAVKACAERGVKIAVVMASGFAETGADGRKAEQKMIGAARASNMRIVGPNTQGIANFATGTVASFATLFNEVEPADGGVAIVSQSGAMSVVPYALLRQRGIGVRHSHATGNEADLTVADFTLAVVRDPAVKLVLLYMEAVADPETLAEAARIAQERDLPIIAVKAGRSASGQQTASSHTGAVATEDRVVSAFLKSERIWRADDIHQLVNAVELYLKGWRPKNNSFVAISNSGASCVMAADLAEKNGLKVAELPAATVHALREKLPAFAAARNPIDLTAALLTNNRLFGSILPVIGASGAGESVLISLPIAGKGYDTRSFAEDTAAAVQSTGKAIVVGVPQEKIAAQFREHCIPTFIHDSDAIAALGQLAAHAALMRKPRPAADRLEPLHLPPGKDRFLSEWQSIEIVRAHGIPVAKAFLCNTAEAAVAAAGRIGGAVAMKACSPDAPHKAEYGLVRLNLRGEHEVRAAFQALSEKLKTLGFVSEGVIVAEMLKARRELILGARNDPSFGTLVMLGDGGKYIETLRDSVLLRFPFTAADAVEVLQELRIAPLFAGIRGEAPYDLEALAGIAVKLGALAARGAAEIRSIDLNPVMACENGSYAVADALIERNVNER